VRSADELRKAVNELGTPAVLKTAEFGYDGKGQSKIESINQCDSTWASLNCPLGVVEGFIRFTREISVIIARNSDGEMRAFDVFENVHVNHILDVTTVDSRATPGLPMQLRERATQLARAIALKLDLVGVLCVEMFVTPDAQVIVNELAPRPHNSGHVTFDACVTSQFEQQLRAVCGLPLGDTTLLRPAAMANLLGDVWLKGRSADDKNSDHNQNPFWAKALVDPFVKLHLYGKTDARAGRKMGHLTATGRDTTEAAARVIAARERL
jgi:5-(carboxyamino)imidazole ribonucleotide synthase